MNITDEQIAAGVRGYRARCLDHGIEWNTTVPQSCPECTGEYLAANPAPAAPDEPMADDNIQSMLDAAPTVAEKPKGKRR